MTKKVLSPVELLREIRKYMVPGFVMPVPEQAKYIVRWIDETLAEHATEPIQYATQPENSIATAFAPPAHPEPNSSPPAVTPSHHAVEGPRSAGGAGAARFLRFLDHKERVAALTNEALV